MNRLLVIGAGSFATEVDELAHLLGYSDLAFLDDSIETARTGPVIGTLKDIEKFRNQFPEAIVAFGNNDLRMQYFRQLGQIGYSTPSLIHPTAYISPDAIIMPGCIIRARAVVSRYVELGEASIINVGAVIDHDCILGSGCHVLIGAVVRNKVHVPEMTWIPANAVIE